MRVRRVLISTDLAQEFLTEGHQISGTVTVEHGISPGAKLINCGWAGWQFWLDFTHESFEELPQGAVPQSLNITFRKEV